MKIENKHQQGVAKCVKSTFSSFSIQTRYSSRIKKCKEKRKEEEKIKEQRRTVSSISIPILQKNLEMNLFGDLVISTNGEIRLCCVVNHISFGGYHALGQSVELNKQTNCINIRKKKNDSLQACTLLQAKMITSNLPKGKERIDLFDQLNFKIFEFQNEMEKHILTQQFQDQIDEDFEEVQSLCFEYLKSINCYSFNSAEINCNLSSETSLQQHSQIKESCLFPINQISSLGMFTYSIGRVNWKTKEIQQEHQGYSNGYLELIGLDKESLILLELRQKRMDLIRDNHEITQQSTIGLVDKIMGSPFSNQKTTNIVTFDGFPIKICQKTIKVELPKKFQGRFSWRQEYSFKITDINVDMIDIQNLIKYREQIVNKSNSMPIDAFVQKELSFRFEDIEYSIHSESLIDKYYFENLIALKRIEESKKSENIAQYAYLKSGQKINPIQVLANSYEIQNELNK